MIYLPLILFGTIIALGIGIDIICKKGKVNVLPNELNKAEINKGWYKQHLPGY
jgi:hypothetical protein